MTSTSTRSAGLLAAAAVLALLQGCTTMTRFESAAPGAKLSMAGAPNVALPVERAVESKATGQHPFMVEAADGKRLYGILPLRVNGGTMAGSIALFAPALFIGGFRDSYNFYQFDTEAGVLRYRMKETDEWRTMLPTEAEKARAKAHFPAPAESRAPAAAPAKTATAP